MKQAKTDFEKSFFTSPIRPNRNVERIRWGVLEEEAFAD
jgi:hypothetical protein